MTSGSRSSPVAALLGLFIAAAVLPTPVAAERGDAASITFAEKRGRLLFELDRAAWVATDDMVATTPNWQESGIKGYIVEQAAQGFTVTFYGGGDEAPVAFYTGQVANREVKSRQVHSAATRPLLTGAQKRLVAIRAAAQREAAGKVNCAEAPLNVTVIPPPSPNTPADIYLMTPQVKAGEFPFGGHYRATVAPDGRVTGSRAFTKACLTMPQPENAAAMVVSHLLDPVPTEIHVFTSLTAGLPVYVSFAEPRRVFAVAGDKITLVKK